MKILLNGKKIGDHAPFFNHLRNATQNPRSFSFEGSGCNYYGEEGAKEWLAYHEKRLGITLKGRFILINDSGDICAAFTSLASIGFHEGDTVKVKTPIDRHKDWGVLNTHIYCTVVQVLDGVAMIVPWDCGHECLAKESNLRKVKKPDRGGIKG